jgi:[ribosomal protein S5]-alanine N-acetyltransferase
MMPRQSGESLHVNKSTIYKTSRLILVPSTVELARAEMEDRGGFGRLLGAIVPDNWPPETVADALPLFLSWLESAPDQIGWFGWYALSHTTEELTLVGSGGFLGPPNSGTVQLGYSVLPQYQRQGYATEMVSGLVRWAFSQPSVTRIVAETEWANPASVRVLEKTGFQQVGPADEAGGMLFELQEMTRDRVENDCC